MKTIKPPAKILLFANAVGNVDENYSKVSFLATFLIDYEFCDGQRRNPLHSTPFGKTKIIFLTEISVYLKTMKLKEF